MEKITVTKVLKTQEVEGKFGPQVRSAFTSAEYGDKILSVFAKYAVKEGQELEGTVETQERDGKTYHNFKFAPKNKGGISGEDMTKLMNSINAVNTNVLRVISLLQNQGKESTVKYPTEEINPDDVPF